MVFIDICVSMEIEQLVIHAASSGDSETLRRMLKHLAYRTYLANPEIRKRLYTGGQQWPVKERDRLCTTRRERS